MKGRCGCLPSSHVITAPSHVILCPHLPGPSGGSRGLELPLHHMWASKYLLFDKPPFPQPTP